MEAYCPNCGQAAMSFDVRCRHCDRPLPPRGEPTMQVPDGPVANHPSMHIVGRPDGYPHPRSAYTPPLNPPVPPNAETHYFLVKGSGEFPFDMLRYDIAWAITRVAPEGSAWPGKRAVFCATYSASAPTQGRWESFGWQVLDSDMPKPGFLS